jgi:hypothetical protein
MRNVYEILVRKPKRKTSLGRHRHKQEDNTKMYLTEMGCEDVDWICPCQDRVQWQDLINKIMNL